MTFSIGLLSVLPLYLITALGYVPDTMYKPLLAPVGPIGMLLLILGTMLLVASWVLHGFLPDLPSRVIDATPRRAHLEP